MVSDTQLRNGSCHCGGVRFTVRVPAEPRVRRCNCTICSMKGVVMLDVPLFPSLVARIVAVPAPSPLTRPVGDTLVTDGASVVHVKLRPVSTSSSASSAVAVSCTVPPTRTLADVGATLTDTTGATGPP